MRERREKERGGREGGRDEEGGQFLFLSLQSASLSSGSRQRLATLETVEYYVGKYGKFSPSQSQDT